MFYYYYYFDVVEVCLKPSSTARIEDVRLAVERFDFRFLFLRFCFVGFCFLILKDKTISWFSLYLIECLKRGV